MVETAFLQGTPLYWFVGMGVLLAVAVVEGSRRLGKINRELRGDIAELRTQMAVQEERHRVERGQDASFVSKLQGVIGQLQNEIMELRVYIAMLRGLLADRGIVSPDPPATVKIDSLNVEVNNG